MPYRRKPRSQRKHNHGKVKPHILKKYGPEKRSLIKFGIVPKSVLRPVTHQPLTKKLASSSKKDRDDGIAMVRSVLLNADTKGHTKMDKKRMTQLWVALFYSFWMSDKILIQQELARKLANFIKICSTKDVCLLYIECFMECMEREWSGIDYLRMNKFLSLLRYFIHASFDYLALNEWDLDLIQRFSNILRYKIDLISSSNRGLFLHLNDIYIEELVKINRIDSDDHLSKSFRPPISFDALYNLLCPFITIYLESNKMEQQQYVIRKIFYKLMETMNFNKEERENKLNCPGMHDIDLYKFNINDIDTNNNNNIGAFIDDEMDENDKNDEIMINNDNFHNESMEGIDPYNPVRRKKNEDHLMFDKKNFDVVMPFKEFEKQNDRKKVEEWERKYKNNKIKRENDPLLMRDKMEQFQKVFDYLANHEETPNKARKKLNVLSKIFVFKKENVDNYYDRNAIKDAIKFVDNTSKLRKWNKIKQNKKKTMRNLLKHQKKWTKLRKQGFKMKPTKKLSKRASRFIL